MAAPKSTTGLAYLSSLEKMPKRPALRGPNPVVEMEKWIAELENYLRRLYGLLTAANVLTTVNEGGGLPWIVVVDKWYTFADNTSDTFYISESDWRGRWLLVGIQHPSGGDPNTDEWTLTSDQLGNPHLLSLHLYGNTYAPGSDQSVRGFTMYSSSSCALEIENGTGKLKLSISTLSAGTINHLRVLVLASAKKTSVDEAH